MRGLGQPESAFRRAAPPRTLRPRKRNSRTRYCQGHSLAAHRAKCPFVNHSRRTLRRRLLVHFVFNILGHPSTRTPGQRTVGLWPNSVSRVALKLFVWCSGVHQNSPQPLRPTKAPVTPNLPQVVPEKLWFSHIDLSSLLAIIDSKSAEAHRLTDSVPCRGRGLTLDNDWSQHAQQRDLQTQGTTGASNLSA